MIAKNVVYHKSGKGTEAIATRQHGLSPRLRSMLILIDGKRGFEELARLSQALGEIEQLLGQLLEDGFIEAAAPGAPAAAAAAKPVAASPAVSLQDARRYAVRRLTDLLGPNAEELCLRIEGSRDLHDFQVAVKGAEGMVRQFRGGQAAQDFSAQVHAHMAAR